MESNVLLTPAQRKKSWKIDKWPKFFSCTFGLCLSHSLWYFEIVKIQFPHLWFILGCNLKHVSNLARLHHTNIFLQKGYHTFLQSRYTDSYSFWHSRWEENHNFRCLSVRKLILLPKIDTYIYIYKYIYIMVVT